MHINFHNQCLLVCLALVGTCFLLAFAKGGRGVGGRGRSRGGWRFRWGGGSVSTSRRSSSSSHHSYTPPSTQPPYTRPSFQQPLFTPRPHTYRYRPSYDHVQPGGYHSFNPSYHLKPRLELPCNGEYIEVYSMMTMSVDDIMKRMDENVKNCKHTSTTTFSYEAFDLERKALIAKHRIRSYSQYDSSTRKSFFPDSTSIKNKTEKLYTCRDTRFPEHYLGRYTWQPYCGSPTPAYMSYAGIPTGANMNEMPHRRKGFIGSLMSSNKGESVREKQSKYHGTFPSPYGIRHIKNSDSINMNKHFLDKYSASAALYTIFPFMAQKDYLKLHKMRFQPVLMYSRRRLLYQQRYQHLIENGKYVENTEYSNIFNNYYIGNCQQPLKRKHSKVECMSTFDEIKCNTSCNYGYQYPQNNILTNHCWHLTGIWRPQKNFPECKPICNNKCQNGGTCIDPDKCSCIPGFRGSQCQFHFTVCDIRLLTAEDRRINWSCRHLRNETVCKVTCKERAEFESPPAYEYKCTVEGLWSPDTLPPCTVK